MVLQASTAAVCSVKVYQRRQPQNRLLHRTVAAHLGPFIDHTSEQGGTLPYFVHREFTKFLSCGVLAHGFLRLYCGSCRLDRLVAFSCKGRGFCPSCGARRMVDGAAHWVDRVLPRTPVRQWVLSLPHRLRFRIGFNRTLCSRVLGAFIRASLRWYRQAAKRHLGLASTRQAHGGAVSCIQRFSGALGLNVHFHVLIPDGVFLEDADGGVRFAGLPAPSRKDLSMIAQRVRDQVATILAPYDEGSASEDAVRAEPLLSSCAAASAQGRVATGAGAGGRVARRSTAASPAGARRKPSCAEVDGFNLHAGVRTAAHERKRLERLARYILRPPLSQERLEALEDGRLAYHFKHAWQDGTRQVVLSGHELIEKLVPLVPPPRAHQVVYHGVLAANARLRCQVVPPPRMNPPSHSAQQALYRRAGGWTGPRCWRKCMPSTCAAAPAVAVG